MKCYALSSLCKVFSNEEPQGKPFSSMTMLLNERSSFQAAVFSQNDERLTISISPKLFEKYINIFSIEDIHGDLVCYEKHDDYFLRVNAGEYPDLLRPVIGGQAFVIAGSWKSFWFELDPCSKVKAGKYQIEISFTSSNKQNASFKIDVEIINALLPDSDLICTNWLHTDCLSTWYDVEVFSDEYWRITENFVRAAVRHGINFILTPLFTPPLDTKVGGERPTVQLVKVYKNGENYSFGFEKLEKWVNMCDRCGVKLFEMSHLFTQWGAKCAPNIIAQVDNKEKRIFGWNTRAGGRKYIEFLTQFSQALIEFIDAHSLRERCIFHVSDEPSKASLATYKKRCSLMLELFKGFRIIDALSDFSFIEKGVCSTPIPAIDRIEPFIGNVDELWTYYCCGQQTDYVSNKFFAMPSLRNRILGVQMYKHNVKGFLQWGYNFWYSRLSEYCINPFEVSDADKNFPSGDAFSVYPGEGGEPLLSLRLKVFYDGIQDYSALKLLESYLGHDETVRIIEDGLSTPLTFSEYPKNDEWLVSLRDCINRKIKSYL